jgi:hypothetical protein
MVRKGSAGSLEKTGARAAYDWKKRQITALTFFDNWSILQFHIRELRRQFGDRREMI